MSMCLGSGHSNRGYLHTVYFLHAATFAAFSCPFSNLTKEGDPIGREVEIAQKALEVTEETMGPVKTAPFSDSTSKAP